MQNPCAVLLGVGVTGTLFGDTIRDYIGVSYWDYNGKGNGNYYLGLRD